jgi:aldehyde dehydrogenase (NAD+)
LIIQEKIYDKFIKKMVTNYEKVRIGDPLDPKTLMGPLIDEGAVKDYEDAIKAALEQGGKLICGGKVLRRKGCARTFVQPTIIEIANKAPIVQSETFAPILYVMKYKKMDQAIKLHNGVPQGLSSSIFTDSMAEAEAFYSYAGSDCGLANVNIGTSGAEIGGAFGGEKETGGGRESGSDCWKAYMRRQTNTINWGGEVHLAQGVKFEA